MDRSGSFEDLLNEFSDLPVISQSSTARTHRRHDNPKSIATQPAPSASTQHSGSASFSTSITPGRTFSHSSTEPTHRSSFGAAAQQGGGNRVPSFPSPSTKLPRTSLDELLDLDVPSSNFAAPLGSNRVVGGSSTSIGADRASAPSLKCTGKPLAAVHTFIILLCYLQTLLYHADILVCGERNYFH